MQIVHVETSQWNNAPDGPALAPAKVVDAQPLAYRRRSLPFTSVAFLTATALLITEGVAVNLATGGKADAATTIAELLMWMTAIPFVLGLVGLVLGPHRVWAFAAMIVAVIANPFLLRTILTFFGGL